jgi:hypothetical protein
MAGRFAVRKTFHFTADGRCRGADEILLNIDVDRHKSGSLTGALAFVVHLRATRFSGLYYEARTNGNGVHGYLVLVKHDLLECRRCWVGLPPRSLHWPTTNRQRR